METSQAMSRIELHFQVRKLFPKCEPLVTVYTKHYTGLELIGQTERAHSSNPDFAQSVKVDYFFEEEQTLVCKVWHRSADDSNLIGQFQFPLAKLVAVRGQQLEGNLNGPKSHAGEIKIIAESIDASNKISRMRFSIDELSRKQQCCMPRPEPLSLVIRRVREDGSWVKVCETEPTLASFEWAEMEVKVDDLCNGDQDRPLKVEIVEETRVLCETQTTLNRLCHAEGKGIELQSKTPCQLYPHVNLIELPSFLDYLKGGLDINLHVAIDFTASNGNPMEPNSLHCLLNPNTHNQYQQVIQSVGSILQHYDTDKKYPVYGFGAKKDGHISHCFNCSPDGEVDGLEGIHQAYLETVRSVHFHGPTLFAPIIHRVNFEAQQSMRNDPYKFHVLLILTDGCIHDMAPTIDAIVQSSALPISIIIVGIGEEEDFSKMNELDADSNRLVAQNGECQKHDNVQFVPYKSCGSSARLTREVLAELPDQVVTHFRQRNLLPQPRVKLNNEFLVASAPPNYAAAA